MCAAKASTAVLKNARGVSARFLAQCIFFWREHLDAQGAFRKPDEIRALYESRGVTPDKIVIPVCHGGYRSASTFIALKSLAYPDVRNYVSAWGEWGNRDDSLIVIPPA